MKIAILFGLFVGLASSEYLGKIFCNDQGDISKDKCSRNSMKNDEDCPYLVGNQEVNCSNVMVWMKKLPRQDFDLRLYWTQNECTLPNLDNLRDGMELISEKQVSIADLEQNKVSLGDVDLNNIDKCGLISLVLVLSNSTFEYIDHVSKAVFIQCPDVDFEIEGLNVSTIEAAAGLKNPFPQDFELKVNGDFEQCQPKILMCLTCQVEFEDLALINKSSEARSLYQTMLATSSFDDLMEGWSSCFPLHQGSLALTRDSKIDLSETKIPCNEMTAISGNTCGLIAFIDPMDKCLDSNRANNLLMFPLLLKNSSQCTFDHLEHEQCSINENFLKKGGKNAAVVSSYNAVLIKRGGQIVPSHLGNHQVRKSMGMKKAMQLHVEPQCQDRCTLMYEKKRQEFEAQPKLSSRLIRVLNMVLSKFSDSQRTMKKVATLGAALLRCMEEDPDTCPFKNKLTRQFVKMMKGSKGTKLPDMLYKGMTMKKNDGQHKAPKGNWRDDPMPELVLHNADITSKLAANLDGETGEMKDKSGGNKRQKQGGIGKGQGGKGKETENVELDEELDGEKRGGNNGKKGQGRPNKETAGGKKPGKEGRPGKDTETGKPERPERERPELAEDPWNMNDFDIYDFNDTYHDWNDDDYDWDHDHGSGWGPTDYDLDDWDDEFDEVLIDLFDGDFGGDILDDFRDDHFRPRPPHGGAKPMPHERPSEWNVMKSLNCQRVNRRCEKNRQGFDAVSQCICQLMWARNSEETDNKFCQAMSESEKDDISGLAISGLRGNIMMDLLPSNKTAQKMVKKAMKKFFKNATNLMEAPIQAEELLTLVNELTLNLENIDDVGEMGSDLKSALVKLSLNDLQEITSLINDVKGYFELGQSCDLSGDIGSFPSRDEFCSSTLGQTYMESANTCSDHNEELHRISALNYHFLKSNSSHQRSKRSIAKDPMEMKPVCKENDHHGPVYWRRENCMVKMGQFCPLTKEFHWKSLVACTGRSCNDCQASIPPEKFNPLMFKK